MTSADAFCRWRTDGGDIQAALTKATGQRTVPMVFVGGQLIGGGSETAAAAAAGTLMPALQAAGALPDAER